MLTRGLSTVVFASVLVLAAAGPASAGRGWGSAVCEQATGGCDLAAGTRPSPNAARERLKVEGATRSACTYYEIVDGAAFEALLGAKGGATRHAPAGHRHYLKSCPGERPEFVVLGPGAPAPPSPEEVAREARGRLRLPAPRVVMSPGLRHLVGLPSWLWLERAGWRSVSETVAVPGVSVTATATPVLVSWSMGDGTTVSCSGPGTPYVPGGAPGAASPDCGHVFRFPSTGQRGGVFAVTATVRWRVTWAGAGQAGVLPELTMTGRASARVVEVQALATV
ncbi:hypothetical protein [Allokutzneria albata]|uniref:PKD domain-containing protein n=1 Tax=Allokutzneria albata TaxID=211114 RepID=A0A1G9YA37_ALLAB|nr:hypothetical protein [Allokutzneria albata]SDN05999.1 hypothetical protein SAMN04489726_4695 [Allokutzneria albata]